MSPHLSEGTLQRLLDGELTGAEREAAERHVGVCSLCHGEMRTLEAVFATVAQEISRVEPAETSLELAHAAWRRRMRTPWTLHLRRHLPRAALFVLAVAGVASATLPGSPVRRWAESVWQAPHAAELRPAIPAAPAEAPLLEPASAGVRIGALDGDVRLLVERASPELRIRVRLTDEAWLSVRGTGEAADARFRTSRGRVSVEDAAGGELQVGIPRSARHASISVGGRRILVKDGETLHVLVPADSTATEVVFSSLN